ncbi:MAG: aspartoacylase, partial [Flavobacteriaceae bacterium]|nr:aspartoacylase [Flavobacteriaceae bacterium]
HHLEKQILFSDKFYEILYRYEIEDNSSFSMYNGYRNFQKIRVNDLLAVNNDREVRAPMKGHIFMPLYQGKGNDGFFVIRSIPRFFLRLSLFLRKVYFDRFLVLLPGIKWASPEREALRVNLKVARFYTKKLFHLLGYRSRTADKTHLIMTNREVASKMGDYKNAAWFK